MIVRFIRRLLLRIAYRLPHKLQRPFYRSLYDGEPPQETGPIRLSTHNGADEVIRFEFVGGSLDGKVYQGPIANPFYWQTEHGRVGCRFKVASEADVDASMAGEPTGPILKHDYEIVENRVEGGIRFVQAKAI
jgi:hypothetical protein